MNAEYVERQLDDLSPTEREKCMLDLSFGGEMTDEKLHTLIDDLDLDTENQNYLLMLSSLGFSRGWEWFPLAMVPRLKGLHRYHQAHVSIGIPRLVQQIRLLSDEGIPVMLLKGVAMLTYYAPGRPRLMYDYDFAVPETLFDTALELFAKNGNELRRRSPRSVVVQGDHDSINMHRWTSEMYNEQLSDIWDRAEVFPLHGVDVRVPSQENMFLLLMDTQSYNYFRSASATHRLQWLFDSVDIWNCSDELSIENLASRARELRITNRVRVMFRVFMQCLPGLFEAEEFERAFPKL